MRSFSRVCEPSKHGSNQPHGWDSHVQERRPHTFIGAKMIAYIMIFVHNDRLWTVHDDIQTVKIDIQ